MLREEKAGPTVPDKNEELCAITVFRKTWALLNESRNLEEAKEKFRKLVLELVLHEGE
jgi:hypothetical protein